MEEENEVCEILLDGLKKKWYYDDYQYFMCGASVLNEILSINRYFIYRIENIKSLEIYEDKKDIAFKLTDRCFSKIKTIERIIFKCNVITRGTNWFSGCENLKQIIGLNIEIIKRYAFYNCKKLEEYPGSIKVKKIECLAFSGCKSIKFLYLPNCGEFGIDCFKNIGKDNLVEEKYISIDRRILLNDMYKYICNNKKIIDPIETNIEKIKINN